MFYPSRKLRAAIKMAVKVKRLKKGQGVLEYTLFLAAVVAAIMVILFRSGGFQTSLSSTYGSVLDAMGNTTLKLSKNVFGM